MGTEIVVVGTACLALQYATLVLSFHSQFGQFGDLNLLLLPVPTKYSHLWRRVTVTIRLAGDTILWPVSHARNPRGSD